MKIKSNNILNYRDKLSKDINHHWLIIRRENTLSKNLVRNYDLSEIANKITQKAKQRVKTKLLIQAVNMGYAKFDIEMFKNDTNYYSIFLLSELNEQLTQWDIVQKYSTIDPKVKGKKTTKSLKSTEHFSFAKIRAIKKKLQLEINALNKKIEDFNNAAEIEANDDYSFLLAA